VHPVVCSDRPEKIQGLNRTTFPKTYSESYILLYVQKTAEEWWPGPHNTLTLLDAVIGKKGV